jgi:hypothetical protein
MIFIIGVIFPYWSPLLESLNFSQLFLQYQISGYILIVVGLKFYKMRIIGIGFLLNL